MPQSDASRFSQVRPTVRSAMLSDAESLTVVDALCFPAGIAYTRGEIASLLRSRSTMTVVAEVPTAVVGFAALGLVPTTGSNPTHPIDGLAKSVPNAMDGELITIDVLPEYRRVGVGVQLYQALEDWFRAGNGRRMELHVAADNAAAIAFYRQLGYTPMQLVPAYYLASLDAWQMEKYL